MSGLLNFKYTQPRSRAREEYLLSFLEREDIKQVAHLRATVDAIFGSSFRIEEVISSASNALRAYTQMTLPSEEKKAIIESVDKIDPKSLAAIKERFAKYKKKSKNE